jgi:hypothetical protein
LAAATDRYIGLCDLRRNTQERLDLRLVELTHLVIKPDSFGLAIVQERDRIGRATPAGRWVWKHELPTPVEDLAVGSEGFAAATTNDGRLLVFDPAGEVSQTAGFDPSDPPLLVEAPDGSPPGVAWVSLSRRGQKLTGHGLRGAAVWTRQVPWEGWSLVRLGGLVVVASADGRAMAFDGSGAVRHEGAPTGGSNDLFFLDPDSIPLRVARKGIHVVCATLEGRVRWRMIGDQPIGPCAAGRGGVALMLGAAVAWFGNDGPESGPTA